MLTRWQELLRQHNAQQQAATGQGQGGGDDEALPNPGGATYYRQSARSGPFVPPGMERLARFGYDAAQETDTHDARQRSGLPGLNNGSGNGGSGGNGGNGGTGGNDTTQQDRWGTVLGNHIAQAFTRSAGGMLAGGIRGAANAAGMGATGDVLAGLARPLMTMAVEAAPLALGAIGAVAGVAGIGLGVNALQSKYAGEERTLAGSVGTSTGATPEGELTTAQNAGWRYWYHEADSVKAAQQLGDVGVTSDQMGGALTQSMALARLSGVGLDQTTALTGQMMQGGMSSNQVGQAYAEMDQVSRLIPVSLGRITESIKAVNAAAGVGQISLNGLAATQALSDQTGMKINIGQAMAGTIGSTGTSALAQGAILGLDPTAFSNAQRDPARLWDAYAATARRYDVGAGGSRIAQQALSEAGFDFSGMKGNQAETFIKKLVAEGPNAAQTYEASLQKKEAAPGAAGPHTADQFAAAGKAFADQVTPVGEQLKINLEAGAAAIVRATGQIAPAPSGHDNVVNAQATYQAAQQLANAQRLHQSPAVIAARERALLQADPNATGTSLSGAPAILNAGAENPALRQPFPPGVGDPFAGDLGAQSIRVQTTHGPAYLKPNIVHGAEAASRKTGVPLAILLAQAAQESGGDPHAVSPDGGYGAYQFTDDASARKYLHVAPGQDWHGAAYDPKRSAEGAAEMDADLYKRAGGNWQKALAMNNAGTNGWNYTGHPGQGRDYGTAVYGSAQDVEHRLEVVVHVKDQTSGKTVGQTHTTHSVRTSAAHSVDPSRKHVAATSYGPDQRPPSPGLPNLTGHIGGPLQR